MPRLPRPLFSNAERPLSSAGAELLFRRAGFLLGPVASLIVLWWNPAGVAAPGRRLLAIITLAVIWWMTEALPLPATALLASALAIVFGVAPARQVLAPFADPIIFLFVGSFLLSQAFSRYGLDLRFAGYLLRMPLFSRTHTGLMAGIGIGSAAISTCLSNTATAALMTPIAAGTVTRRGGTPAPTATAADGDARRTSSWGSGVLLMVAYGASIGGMATIIGTPPNLLVAGFIERLTGVRITFADWLLFGVPIAATLLSLSMFWTWICNLRGEPAPAVDADDALAPTPPREDAIETHRGRRWTILAFVLVGILWTLPALSHLVLGSDAAITRGLVEHLPEAGAALLCAGLLFAAPINFRRGRFALSWEDGQRVNWGIILLFGGGLSLGTLAESAGLARWAGEGIQGMGLASTPAGLMAVAIALSILVSEFASNTASATLLVPVVIAAAQASGFDPVRPALAAGLAATCGFIFPVSTPPNAIVFGTRMVPLSRMILTGILLDVTAFFVIWLGMLALSPLLPVLNGAAPTG